MTSTPRSSSATPSPLLQAARELAPLIREYADAIDAARELPRPVFNAIADAGLFRMAIPREIGGFELDLPTYTQVIEELAKADASTAWAVNQGSTFATNAARLKPEVAREVWIDTPRSVVSNSPGATAKAIVVEGGYRVTGRQGFSTGCRHASWVAAHAQVIENGQVRMRGAAPEGRYLLVPIAQVELLDTWRTRGMRGTGTHHFEVKDVFVPAERTFLARGEPQLTGGVRYKIPIGLAFASGDGAAALGLARSCIDAFLELAGSKSPHRMQGLLRDQAMVQFIVGHAEATLRSGRAFLMEAVEELWDDLTANGELSLKSRAAVRLATTHAIRLAAQIVESIYSASGATAVFEGHVIQRHFQDIHVITQHLQGRLSHYETVGQYWLGLPVDETRF